MPKSSESRPERTYAGLDVSLKQTAICIVDEAGKIERAKVSASVTVLGRLAQALAVDPCDLIRVKPRP